MTFSSEGGAFGNNQMGKNGRGRINQFKLKNEHKDVEGSWK